MSFRTPSHLLVALTLGTACATGPTSSARLQSRLDVADSRASLLARRPIARVEILGSGAQTAEEVVRRFRPSALTPVRPRGAIDPSLYLPAVYIDDVRSGGVEILRGFPASALREVRFYTETEANVRYLGPHPVGAIALRTR
ncbi:MAG TPA: hypothetical protein VEA99_09125 [Gemmatimonadaceae bacterium]|nr:hypothetical protein [Gemmatimonadaceae bacterium]